MSNSNINEISVKSHTFIITRSDSDIDKIDRRYTLLLLDLNLIYATNKFI